MLGYMGIYFVLPWQPTIWRLDLWCTGAVRIMTYSFSAGSCFYSCRPVFSSRYWFFNVSLIFCRHLPAARVSLGRRKTCKKATFGKRKWRTCVHGGSRPTSRLAQERCVLWNLPWLRWYSIRSLNLALDYQTLYSRHVQCRCANVDMFV